MQRVCPPGTENAPTWPCVGVGYVTSVSGGHPYGGVPNPRPEVVAGETNELWAMRWHPQGPSGEVKSHLHLGDPMLSDQAPVTSDTHLGNRPDDL